MISENQEREKYSRKYLKYSVRTHLKEIQIKVMTYSRNKSINEESRTIPDSDNSGEIELSPLFSGLLEGNFNEIANINIKSPSNNSFKSPLQDSSPMNNQEKNFDLKEHDEIYEVNFYFIFVKIKIHYIN